MPQPQFSWEAIIMSSIINLGNLSSKMYSFLPHITNIFISTRPPWLLPHPPCRIPLPLPTRPLPSRTTTWGFVVPNYLCERILYLKVSYDNTIIITSLKRRSIGQRIRNHFAFSNCGLLNNPWMTTCRGWKSWLNGAGSMSLLTMNPRIWTTNVARILGLLG